MRVAYQINLHHRPDQFQWLFSALYDEDDLFLIHVNARTSEDINQSIRQIAGQRPNVVFLPRMEVHWGGWSLVETELQGLRRAVELPGWDYFIKLSGQDYPLRDRAGRREVLTGLEGRCAVICNEMSALPLHIRRRTWLHHTERDGALRALPLPNPGLFGRPLRWKGSGWHMLSRGFCEWLVESPVTRDMVRRTRTTAFPDEFFMPNLIQESPWRDRRVDMCGTQTYWRARSPNPDTLTMAHLPDLLTSDQLFARKFDAQIDAKVLTALAERIGATVPAAQEAAA